MSRGGCAGLARVEVPGVDREDVESFVTRWLGGLGSGGSMGRTSLVSSTSGASSPNPTGGTVDLGGTGLCVSGGVCVGFARVGVPEVDREDVESFRALNPLDEGVTEGMGVL